jgi:hypothetical protein
MLEQHYILNVQVHNKKTYRNTNLCDSAPDPIERARIAHSESALIFKIGSVVAANFCFGISKYFMDLKYFLKNHKLNIN